MYTKILNGYRQSGQGQPPWLLEILEGLGAPCGVVKVKNNEATGKHAGEVSAPSMADFKKLEYEKEKMDSKYEQYYNKIKAVEDIKKLIGEEEISIWQLEKGQLKFIQKLLGISSSDDIIGDTTEMTINRLDAVKVNGNIVLEGTGADLINSKCLERLIAEINKEIDNKKAEEKEIRELQIQIKKAEFYKALENLDVWNNRSRRSY